MGKISQVSEERSGFVVELNNWKMRDSKQFQAALGKEDYAAIGEYGGKVILSWPFEGLPTDGEAWENLTIPQFAAATNAIKIAIRQVFSEGE